MASNLLHLVFRIGLLQVLVVLGSFGFASTVGAQRETDAGERLPRELQEIALRDALAKAINLREPMDPRPPTFGAFDDEIKDGIGLRRGVLLTPYQRLALYGQNVGPKRRDEQRMNELAAPELWVVVFPYSRDRAAALLGDETSWKTNPRAGLGSSSGRGGEVLWPQRVTVDVTTDPRRTLEPLWTRTGDFPFAAGLRDWVPGKSVVVAFALSDSAIVNRTGRVSVEYKVEGGGRTGSDSSTLWLRSVSDKEWVAATIGRKGARKK